VTWTENTVVVLQAVVDMRGMVLPADAFELLLVQLDRHAAYFAASLKFSALMMSLITKHSNQVRFLSLSLSLFSCVAWCVHLELR
jgi:hypothetical protein